MTNEIPDLDLFWDVAISPCARTRVVITDPSGGEWECPATVAWIGEIMRQICVSEDLDPYYYGGFRFVPGRVSPCRNDFLETRVANAMNQWEDADCNGVPKDATIN